LHRPQDHRYAKGMRSLLLAVLLVPCACSGPQTVPQPKAGAVPPQETERAHLDALNRRALAFAVTEDVHGMQVQDPFRALETDSELTRAWIDAQTEHTERALARYRDEAAERRLQELLGIGTLGKAAAAGDRLFVTRREGDREQAALYVVPAGQAMPEVPLVDPLSWGERAALDWFFPSPDGRRVAFGISHDGDERSVLHVIDVDRRALLPDRIEHAKWSRVAWAPDGNGFYYSRYPSPGEPEYDATHEDTYFPRVFFHTLGRDRATDPLIFGSERGSDVPIAALSPDGRFLTITNHRGFTASDVYLLDRGAAPASRVAAPDARHPLRAVVVGRDQRTSGVVHGGFLYLYTDIDAPRGRIVRVAPERAADPSTWRDVAPEARGTIEDYALLETTLALHYVDEMSSRLVLIDLDGTRIREIELPARGSIESLAADPAGDTLALVFSSYFYPPALFRCTAAGGVLERVHQVAHDLDLSSYTVDQAFVRSADGTQVNVHFVRREPLVRDGDQPVLIYGYGGFAVSLLPSFTRSALYFIERGGIYAVANLRGGGELGEAWHRAGMLEHKPRVFEDFEAVIRWFAESGISRPERIAITGGSNGGLLVGAAVTRAPDTFRAAAAYVGLYDMLRYHLFPPAQLWISEYGDPREPSAARYLHAYSPYHQVTRGTVYPAVLIETADRDTRVSFAHSAKFAAHLQQAQAGPQPIYFYLERAQGHGRGTRLRDMVRRYARMYAFLEHELGLDTPR
jgi:prolyl oligopeptidase